MELYKELLVHLCAKSDTSVLFPQLTLPLEVLVEQQSYQALQEIAAIIADDSLSDSQCFQKIEAIITVLESIGSSGGTRHDFG